MKKLLLILILCIIKVNGYEYQFSNINNTGNQTWFYVDNNNNLNVKQINTDTDRIVYYTTDNIFYQTLNIIKTDRNRGYVRKNVFDNWLKNDLKFLNDFYLDRIQPFLNYLYNDEYEFSQSNHILYSDYKLLYNSDGLAVESIVNDVWAGLYSESEKSSSGYLYDSGGTLIYYNGEKVSWIQSSLDKVLQHVIINLHTLICIISTPVGVCVSVVFVLCLVFYVVEVGRRSIKPIDDNIIKRNLNE